MIKNLWADHTESTEELTWLNYCTTEDEHDKFISRSVLIQLLGYVLKRNLLVPARNQESEGELEFC